MMAECSAAGVPPHVFWGYTYREVHAVMAGAQLVARRQHKLALFAGWNAVNFRNGKRLPNLAEVLRKLDPVRIMSPSAIRATVLGIAAAMGATVVRRKKKA